MTPQPPFSLELTVSALRRRPANIVDRWDGSTYRRALLVGALLLELEVSQSGPVSSPVLQVRVLDPTHSDETERAVSSALDRVLGLSVDLSGFYELASHEEHLGPLARRFCGVKPPRFPSVFEAIINGITFQQISLAAAMKMLNSLVAAFGQPSLDGSSHAFPEPETLARLVPDDIRALGYSRQKSETIIAVALMAGHGEFNRLDDWDNETARAHLLSIRGIGPWTADYVLLRGLGRLNVFPSGDVGARNNLQRWLGIPGKLDQPDVARIMERYQPYSGMVYFHLLLSNLARAGILDAKIYTV